MIFTEIDKWHGMTLDDIRRLEMESEAALNRLRSTGGIRGTKLDDEDEDNTINSGGSVNSDEADIGGDDIDDGVEAIPADDYDGQPLPNVVDNKCNNCDIMNSLPEPTPQCATDTCSTGRHNTHS